MGAQVILLAHKHSFLGGGQMGVERAPVDLRQAEEHEFCDMLRHLFAKQPDVVAMN